MVTTIDDLKISKTCLRKTCGECTYLEFSKTKLHPFGEYNEIYTTLINANFLKLMTVLPTSCTEYQFDIRLMSE